MQLVEKMKAVFGESHRDTLRSMSNLAVTYWQLGRPKEAIEVQSLCVQLKLATLGSDHPVTKIRRKILGICTWRNRPWKRPLWLFFLLLFLFYKLSRFVNGELAVLEIFILFHYL